MKKATLIIGASLLTLGLQAAHADETGGQAPLVMAYVPGNPLMQLPGMNNGVRISQPAIPVELISNVSNAPNPFDSRMAGNEGATRIMYTLGQDAPVRITIYDLLGFKVRRWDFWANAEGGRRGENFLLWDGTNEAGQKVAKGGYLAQIEIETSEGVATAIRKIGVIH